MDELTGFIGYFNAIARVLLPAVAIWLLILCGRMLLRRTGGPPRPLAVFAREDGERYPVLSEEITIGRGTVCDVCLPHAQISRRHAVLTHARQGWRIRDTRSKSGLYINGERADNPAWLEFGDAVSFADVTYHFMRPEPRDAVPEKKARRLRREPSALLALFLLTVFQLITGVSLALHYADNLPPALPICFGGLLLMEWIYAGVRRFQGIGVELLAFFLCGIGLCVAASAAPSSLFKQFAAILLGMAMFCVLAFILKDVERTMKLRYLIGALAVLLLVLNLLIGETRGGAKNWINLGFITVQPSEFVKVAFVFAGCATLERIMTARNTILFVLFSGACMVPLFLMKDFGTASIFFVGMLIMAYMRSGDWKTVALFGGLAGAGAVTVIAFLPYVASRFAVYRHAWEYASTGGYQQTRTMMAIGSGGLFGVGGGRGNLDLVAAADTDLVFGFVSEEWGLIVALCCAVCLLLFAIYAIRSTAYSRSAYYSMAACAAAGIFLFQAALNIFGSTDLLPLTGVTFPLVSNGGSSMAANFAMLAFLKAVQPPTRPEPAAGAPAGPGLGAKSLGDLAGGKAGDPA